MFEPSMLEAAQPFDYDDSPVAKRLPLLQAVAKTSPNSEKFGRLYGASSVMHEVYTQISKVAPCDVSVLIVGENGCGKELVAQTIHEMSGRADAPFLAVNCGALPPTLIEAELFGYEKGAFTGAQKSHSGYFERAHGGTLFLDEISEMPPELQVRLLRVLETHRVQRLGSDGEVECDVRILAATNRDPLQAIQSQHLREDLYYRLAEFPILIPALREREDDVVLLANQFLKQANLRHGTHKVFIEGVEAKLKQHAWPGNVRELKNCIHRAFVMAELEVDIDATGPFKTAEASQEDRLEFSPGVTLEEVERRFIFATLKHFRGDKRRAAAALGISLKTIYNRLNHYLSIGNSHPDNAETAPDA
ncbi:MAG TPA: sigma-54 dependent transcriptional regulator [Rhodocyclaceae bacterium]|jgi:DNA-binding NtrC family response regulator|nr:sigma-54 dependent transcriptional regulator [Rhodocyclaceae bacterium]